MHLVDLAFLLPIKSIGLFSLSLSLSLALSRSLCFYLSSHMTCAGECHLAEGI